MTTEQILLFALLFCVLGLLIWGRWRYDLVAFAALVVAVVAGLVPQEQAFSGFGHPATVVVALVLLLSRGLVNSGVVDMAARYLVDRSSTLIRHLAVMAGAGAALSAVMNNVAALALLLPLDLDAAAKAKRSPALSLMPISFATILGGLTTLIGTPPNIIVATFRERSVGTPFHMFDFTPVGLVCALAGIAFVTLVGWRLIPAARGERDTPRELLDLESYVAEVRVAADSPVVGKRVRDLDDVAEEHEIAVLGLVRRGRRLAGLARRQEIKKSDVLVVEASPAALDKLVGALGLKYIGEESGHLDKADDVGLLEVVVPAGARIEGRSALSLRLLYRQGVNLLGVSRQGVRFRERVRGLPIRAGDILLLLGPTDRLPEVASWLGCLPLADRGHTVAQPAKAVPAIILFAAAIALASVGMLSITVALAAAAVGFVILNIVPLRQLYDSIPWPVVVLLGSLIPIGGALESSGGTQLIADGIVALAGGLSPAVVLVLLMVVTMTLSDAMNNAATAVIAAPIALDIAHRLEVSADPFLMAVAVGASCSFLTPIGHQNNTLIMGPGGYRFGDYWRMGLPLEILIVVVATPMILLVWPL